MTTLVIGGTGKTGSRVAARLRAKNLPVRIGTRHSEIRFDWSDPTTWPACLDGVEQTYITFYPDIALPGGDEKIGAFAEQAVAAGVRRLVLLSGRGEEQARRAEAAFRASGADWTVLRSAFFMQNFSEAAYRDEIVAGRLTMISHSAGEPFIDADDIAAVAVTTLTDPRHIGCTYELTGPRLLTFGAAAAAISDIVGRPIEYRELDLDTYAEYLTNWGMPEDEAFGLAHVFAEALDGRNAYVTTDVAQVLRREPRDFTAYVTSVADTWGG